MLWRLSLTLAKPVVFQTGTDSLILYSIILDSLQDWFKENQIRQISFLTNKVLTLCLVINAASAALYYKSTTYNHGYACIYEAILFSPIFYFTNIFLLNSKSKLNLVVFLDLYRVNTIG